MGKLQGGFEMKTIEQILETVVTLMNGEGNSNTLELLKMDLAEIYTKNEGVEDVIEDLEQKIEDLEQKIEDIDVVIRDLYELWFRKRK